MKPLLTATCLFVLVGLTGFASAQSDGQKPKKGFLNRLFEEKNIDPETRKQVESAAKEMLENKETQDAVKEAAKALADQESSSDLLEVGQGLLADPDSAMKKGTELSQDPDFLSNAAKQVEKMDPDALQRAAAQLAPLANDDRVVAKAIAATSNAAPKGLSPLSVPKPTDPVVKPIPRPNQDPTRITKIIAEQAEFDANTNLVTFEDNVELDHPEFDLTCDILEAELKKQEGTGEDKVVAPTQTAASGGIERATASGYVVIEKLTPDGKTQVAKARRAVYESATGNVVLMVFPQMQDGQNLIKGTSEATRIFLRPNGKYTVEGPAEITLVTPGDSNPLKLKPR